MNKLVSVIIPTYKGNDKLYRAVYSVCKQTYDNIEIIVVDDNNPDTEERALTRQVIAAIQNQYSNINYVQHEKNKNGAAARNTGFRNSKGEYICFLDDDDFMLSERVEKAVRFMESNKEIGICFFDVIKVQDGIKNATVHSQTLKENAVGQLLRIPGLMGTGSNIFLRRDVYEKVNGFDERFIRYQDVEFMGRALSVSKAAWVKDATIVRSKNATNNRPNVYKLKEMQNLLIETAQSSMAIHVDSELPEIRGKLAHNLFSLAVASNVSGQDMRFVLDDLKSVTKMSIADRIKYFLYRIRNNKTNGYILLNTVKKRVAKGNASKTAEACTARSMTEVSELFDL